MASIGQLQGDDDAGGASTDDGYLRTKVLIGGDRRRIYSHDFTQQA
jgi:hypothetical protein